MLKADKGAKQTHGRRSREQPTGPGKGGKSGRARASHAWEPLTRGSHRQRGKATCRAARAAQSYALCRVCHPGKVFLRRGGTPSPPLYTPQPEPTASSQQVPKAKQVDGSRGGSGVQHARLWGEWSGSKKMQLLAWKRARALELTPCTQ